MRLKSLSGKRRLQRRRLLQRVSLERFEAGIFLICAITMPYKVFVSSTVRFFKL